eukprot:2185685-Pleurochrysis_carterae.AAC.1
MASKYALLQQCRIPVLIARATQIRVKWFARKEWLEHQQFKWSKNPTFIAARSPSSGRAPWCSSEAFSDLLPLAPTLTSSLQSARRAP